MIEKFSSRKSKGLGIILLFVSFLVVILAFGLPLLAGNFSIVNFLICALIAIPAIGFFIWFWSSTYYLINTDNLLINSGPLHKTIPISEINTIRLDQNTVGGIIKPTLSWKCLEITYGKGRLISISPENQDKFLSILKEKNTSIEIK